VNHKRNSALNPDLVELNLTPVKVERQSQDEAENYDLASIIQATKGEL